MPTYARAPVEFVRGEGARLWDAEGREYLDFFAGLSVHNLGHCHPRIVAAIAAQAGTLAGPPTFTTPSRRWLCERLAESSLGGRVFSPTPAPRRVSARSSSSASAPMSAASPSPRSSASTAPSTAVRWPRSRRRQARPRGSVRPAARGFVSAPRDDPEALRAAVNERTAAVMIEPVQGEAGVFLIADEVLVAARAACDATGALLVFDEVQCGMGRTGTLWAYEQPRLGPTSLLRRRRWAAVCRWARHHLGTVGRRG